VWGNYIREGKLGKCGIMKFGQISNIDGSPVQGRNLALNWAALSVHGKWD